LRQIHLAVVPFNAFGREMYLPQYAIGRLVETPAQIANIIAVYQDDNETIEPQSALITGYDFLIDQAQAVSDELRTRGITNQTTLINDQWQGPEFRTAFEATHYDLISLNSHFDHKLFYPNGSPTEPNNLVFAEEVSNNPNSFAGTLVFSVGCQSGLNVGDRWYDPGTPFLGSDWAQMFAGEGAAFIGNTGFGYGDADLLAYSERLMFNFVNQLGYAGPNGNTNPSVGGALLEAKQQYFNEKAGGTLSVYDEKLLAEMTLYGLPMQRVELPNQTNVEPDNANTATVGATAPAASNAAAAATDVTPAATIPGLTQTPLNLSLNYQLSPLLSRGRYYSVVGGTTLESAERPVLPLTTISRDDPDILTRGVLMLGGTFADTADFDPVIIGIVAEDTDSLPNSELRFDIPKWYPVIPATVNRFWDVDEEKWSQNVVVTGQLRPTSTSASPKTVGIMRRYSSLNLLVYNGPGTNPDFQSPGVWDVDATNPTDRIVNFSALVRDSAAASFAPATGVLRVVVLYRNVNSNSWSNVDLTYNPTTEIASGSVVVPQNGQYEYFVQAVDNAGNVAAVFDHGNPYTLTVDGGSEPDNRTVYVAVRQGGTIDGISVQANDVLAYTPDQDEWALYFDAEDVSFGNNLNGLALLNDGSILLAPRNRMNIPGVGWVEAQDIVRFTPTSLGASTAGSFALFFDGSDVGLANDVEAITSISLTPAGKLVIGTLGNASVPGPNGQTLNTGGDDLLTFIANTYGAGTSGYFEHYLDGGAIGLGTEKMWATWIDPTNGDVYLTPRVPVTLGGQVIDRNDIVICTPQTTGPITACSFTRYWDGADYRLTGFDIDSIDLGGPPPFEPPTGSITIVKQTTSGGGTFAFTGDLGPFSLTVPGDTSRSFTDIDTGAYLVRETAQAGWSVQSVVCNDPDGGTTIVAAGQALIDLDDGEAITCTFTNAPSGGPSSDVIYISPAKSGTVGGVAYTNGDILRYDGSSWSMYFDGSDVGVKSVKGFVLLPGGGILIAPGAKATLAGVGAVMGQDIVRFTPTSTGNNTTGSFQWYFDGSDVGLTTAAEAIDALTIDNAGQLLISTKGAATVPSGSGTSVRGADEDLLKFTFGTSGATTSGAWTFFFDGSDVGLTREDVDAAWMDVSNGDLYLSVEDAFSLSGGVSGAGGSVFVCDPGTLGSTTTCAYRNYWNAAAVGLTTNVDGLFIQR